MESSVCCQGTEEHCHRVGVETRSRSPHNTWRLLCTGPQGGPRSPGDNHPHAGSPGLEVEDLLGQVADALEQCPDLQDHKVEGEAAGGGHEGLPSEVQRCGAQSQEQVRGTLRSPSPGFGDEQGGGVAWPPQFLRHLGQKMGGSAATVVPGAQGVEKGDAHAHPALTEHPKARSRAVTSFASC